MDEFDIDFGSVVTGMDEFGCFFLSIFSPFEIRRPFFRIGTISCD